MSSLEGEVLSCDEGDEGGPREMAPEDAGAQFLEDIAAAFAARVIEWASKQAPAEPEKFVDDMN